MRAIENFGNILMERVEIKCEEHVGLIDMSILQTFIDDTIVEVQSEPELLQNLVDSFISRCEAVVAKGGGPLKC